jgi:methyltransferase family protein
MAASASPVTADRTASVGRHQPANRYLNNSHSDEDGLPHGSARLLRLRRGGREHREALRVSGVSSSSSKLLDHPNDAFGLGPLRAGVSIAVVARLLERVVGRVRAAMREKPYDPATFWEARAEEDIYARDHPELYAERGWPRRGGELEAGIVPKWLHEAGIETVLVAGAGSGAQYVYLLRHGFLPHGFDISQTAVATCVERFPSVHTQVCNVVGAELHEEPADAVVASAVLQHIPPHQIEVAIASLKALAQKLIVVREMTSLVAASSYQFAHDYGALFEDWPEVHREMADEAAHYRTDLIAWKRPDVVSGAGGE